MRCVVLTCLLLAGCGAKTPPKLDVQRVDVPVLASCVKGKIGPAPEYPDTDAALQAAPEGPERYRLVGKGRVMREQRLAELEAVAANCP